MHQKKEPFFWYVFFILLSACTPSMKSVLKSLDKKDFTGTQLKLQTRTAKIPNDAGSSFVYAKIFSDSAYMSPNLDSAYNRINQAIRIYPNNPKVVVELSKNRIEQENFTHLKKKIETWAYQDILRYSSLEACQNYIDKYASSIHIPEVIKMRNHFAYEEAENAGTSQAFKSFIEKYPDAEQIREAQANYEILVFQEQTKDGSVDSYSNFLKKYPNTPFRSEVEKKIFEMAITDGELQTFENFVKKYPENPNIKSSWWWIWYLTEDKTNFLKKYPQCSIATDLKLLLQNVGKELFPIVENQKVGFIDHSGKIFITPTLSNIEEDYKCEGLVDDFVILQDSIRFGAADLSGKIIVNVEYDKIEALSPATLKVEKNGKKAIFHKAGFPISDFEYEEIEALTPTLLKYAAKGVWGIITHNNKPVLKAEYTAIQRIDDNVFSLHQSGKTAFCTPFKALQLNKDKKTELTFYPEKDAYISHEKYLVCIAPQSITVSQTQGKELIKAIGQGIKENPLGWSISQQGKWAFYDFEGKILYKENTENYVAYSSGIASQSNGKWGFVNKEGNLVVPHEYDSLLPIPNGMWLLKGAKKFVTADYKVLCDVSAYQDVELIFHPKTKNSYLITQKKNKKGVLQLNGKTVVEPSYEQINLMENGLLRIEKAGKYGLMGIDGKFVLQPTLDGLVALEGGYFSTLKRNKFGIYHPENKTTIEPKYESTLKVYEAKEGIFIAKKGENLALVDKKGKNITEYNFGDIRYWTDNLMLGFQDGLWRVYNFRKNYPTDESFEDFRIIKNTPEEIIAITYRSSGNGLISNQKGRLMPEEYSEVINLGSPEKPFYFAEKYISQAKLYVVLYIDAQGKVVRKQTISEEEYEKVACED